MTHPYALWMDLHLASLRDALADVDEAIEAEAVTTVPLTPAAGAPTRAVPGRVPTGTSLPGTDAPEHGEDPSTLIGETRAPVRPELLDLARRAPILAAEAVTNAAWLVASALHRRPLLVYGHAWRYVAGADHPAVGYLRVALPFAPPPAVDLALAELADAAAYAWSALRQDPPRTMLPGNPPCPGCGTRLLRVEQVGPRTAWVVVCDARCRCPGDGCPCGMAAPAARARHIWALADIWAVADRDRVAAWLAEQEAAQRAQDEARQWDNAQAELAA